MTLQTLKIGKQEFVLVARRDFDKLAAQADRQREDDYWTASALEAEAKSRSRNEKAIPLEDVERAIKAGRRRRKATGR